MAYDGTIHGAPVFSARTGFGQSLGAFSAADYISLPGTPFDNTLVAGGSWTVNFWVKGTAASTLDTILEVATAASSGGTNPRFGVFTGLLNIIYPTGSTGFGGVGTTGGAVHDGAWHHIRFTMNAGTDLYAFIDGILSFHTTGIWASVAGSAPLLGRNTPVGNPFPSFYEIDELELRADFAGAANFAPPTAPVSGVGSVALYRLNGDATDSALPPLVVPTPTIGEYGPSTLQTLLGTATGSSGAVTHQLQRAPDVAGSPGSYANVGSPFSTSKYSDTGLTASTSYWYRVVDTDAIGNTGTSSGVKGTTNAAGVKYNLRDTVGPNLGATVRLFVPSVEAAVPYAGAATNLILYCHALGETHSAPGAYSVYSGFMAAAIGTDGYIIVSSDAGGTSTWGTQASLDHFVDAYLAARDLYNINKVYVVGVSMGGLAALSLLIQKKVPIEAMIGAYPVCGLAAQYAAGSPWNGLIDTAYAIDATHTFADTTKGMDPLLHAATDFGGIPILLVCSPNDTSVSEVTNSHALATLLAGTNVVTVLEATGNHASADHWTLVTANYHNFYAVSPAVLESLVTVSGGGR